MSERGWALVTGSSRRIGRALALQAAEAGFDVVAHARDGHDAGETARAVKEMGRAAVVLSGDLANADSVATLIDECPPPLTLLVNCAAVFEDDTVETLNARSLDKAFSVNVRAPVLLAQAFAARLPLDRAGQIVNLIDQRVWRLNPTFFSYTLSKATLWAATQTLAQALAPRIRVNGIGPGPVLASVHQTPERFAAEASATPLARAVEIDQIRGALRYLIDASAVTGQMIAVDAGQHLAWQTPDILGG